MATILSFCNPSFPAFFVYMRLKCNFQELWEMLDVTMSKTL